LLVIDNSGGIVGPGRRSGIRGRFIAPGRTRARLRLTPPQIGFERAGKPFRTRGPPGGSGAAGAWSASPSNGASFAHGP